MGQKPVSEQKSVTVCHVTLPLYRRSNSGSVLYCFDFIRTDSSATSTNFAQISHSPLSMSCLEIISDINRTATKWHLKRSRFAESGGEALSDRLTISNSFLYIFLLTVIYSVCYKDFLRLICNIS